MIPTNYEFRLKVIALITKKTQLYLINYKIILIFKSFRHYIWVGYFKKVFSIESGIRNTKWNFPRPAENPKCYHGLQ